MTNGIAPPGWYRDPSGTGRRRWWNGLAWTAAMEDDVVTQGMVSGSVVQPMLPAGARLHPWPVWLLVLLPLLSLLQLVVVDWPAFLREAGTDAVAGVQPAMPHGLMLAYGIGLATFACTVALAIVDWTLLKRQGVVRPFSWGWVLLMPLVYLIGRAVVLRRRTRRSARGPVWAYLLTSTVAAVAPSVYLSSVLLQVLPELLAGVQRGIGA